MQGLNNFLVNNYNLIKALHVISMVAWMAAILYLPRHFVYHTKVEIKSKTSEMFKVMEYRLQKFIMNPAMVLTIFFGVLLLSIEGTVEWNKKWIYFKLLFVFFMLVVHHLLAKYRIKFFLDKNNRSEKYFKILNEVPTLLLIIIILLVYLKPF